MPGRYSPEKLQARRDRALKRGFLRRKVCIGKTSVLVDDHLAANVKKITRSLEPHSANQGKLGRPFHRARDSSFALRQHLSFLGTDIDAHLAIHRAGNRAKHRVPFSTSRSVDCASSSGVPLNPHARVFDPAVGVNLPLDLLVLHSSDNGDSQLLAMLFARILDLEGQLAAAQHLIDSQNSSLAFLLQQFDPICENADNTTLSSALCKKIDGFDAKFDSLLTDGKSELRKRNKNLESDRTLRVVPTVADASCDTPVRKDFITDQTDLDKANKLILDLRNQNASQVARAARRDVLQSQGRLLQSLVIPSGAMAEHFPITDVFVKFAGAASEADVRDPYLVSAWQLENFSDLIDAFLTKTHVKVVRLTTHTRSAVNRDWFARYTEAACSKGISLSVAFQHDLHLREIVFTNGVAIVSDRGLDLFRAPNHSGIRFCREATILYYEMDHKMVTQHANIAADVAAEAKEILVGSASRDLLAIHAMVGDSSGRSGNMTKKVRQTLEGERVKQRLAEMNLRFTRSCMTVAKSDGYECPATYFATNISVSSGESFQRR